MKYAITVLLLSVCAAAQSSGPAPASQPAASKSAYKTFHDDMSKLSFYFPADMEIQNTTAAVDTIKSSAPEKMKAITDCVSLPLTALRRTEVGVDMYMELRSDATCLGMQINQDSMAGFITSALSSSLAQLGNPTIANDLVKGTLGGHLAYSQSGKAPYKLAPQITFYVTMVCIEAAPNIVCVQLTSTTESGAQALRQLSIQFDGKSQEPLVASKP